MPQSLHFKYGHIVFSTKGRNPLITDEIQNRLYEYIGGIVRNANASLMEINGMQDHIHLLKRETKSISDQDFMRALKADSSKWLNKTFRNNPHFAWQNGYGWFSVGPQDLGLAVQYIQNQKEHHRTESFQEEFRKFLRKYKVKYDEDYLWD